MHSISPAKDIAQSVIQAAPPVVVTALHMGRVALPDIVLLTTLIYTLMQIGALVWRWSRGWIRGVRRPNTR